MLDQSDALSTKLDFADGLGNSFNNRAIIYTVSGDFDDALKSDTEAFGRYFRSMLDQGINLAPAQFEAGFMSIAHSQEDLDKTIAAVEKALKAV